MRADVQKVQQKRIRSRMTIRNFVRTAILRHLKVIIFACLVITAWTDAPRVRAQLRLNPRIVQLDAAPQDEACLDGFQNRRATFGDWVCVTADVANETSADNQAAASRKNAGVGPAGPDTCLSGFVWRMVTPKDHVCVTPVVRTAVTQDNRANASRKKKPWCDQYAQQVMLKVIDAAKSGCKLTNVSLWSESQIEHFKFCMQNPQSTSRQADQTRDDELKTCKAGVAKPTTASAASQPEENVEGGNAGRMPRNCDDGSVIEQIRCRWFTSSNPDSNSTSPKSTTGK
jgi:hypothetical protein